MPVTCSNPGVAPAHGPMTRTFRARRLGAQAGFTLIEMLVVLAIIGLIVGLIGPRVLGLLADSKVKTARIEMANIESALDIYYLDNGQYPTSGEGLAALMRRPAGATDWNGPYLKGVAAPKDPWGRSYNYQAPGRHGPYDLSSNGPNGRHGARLRAAADAVQ